MYDHPANLFVAGFIGSPAMNLLNGISRSGRLAIGDVELSADVAAPDGEVVGIRPEGLRPVGESHDGAGVFDVRVEVVEPLGEEVLVHGSVDAPAVVGAGELSGSHCSPIPWGRRPATIAPPPAGGAAAGGVADFGWPSPRTRCDCSTRRPGLAIRPA